MAEYTRCTRCVMDNSSDQTIVFDMDGHCDYCSDALKKVGTTSYFPNEDGTKMLSDMLDKLKTEGKNKPYDCIMGISGGLDSSYLAYLGYTWGLRILAVHIDDGYDTEISKLNIKKLCSAANIELQTITPDAQQFNALTLAYMRAGVPNLAVPQDNVLFAFLYSLIKKTGVRYFLSGSNFALECILQRDHVYDALDTSNILAIHKKFGTEKIDKLKLLSAYEARINSITGRIITYRPLNYIDYNRDRAFAELADFCKFEYYGRKHLENILTAFVQLYWLPKKFGVDKRSSHLSSMIVSGQMTRQQAIEELEKPLFDEKQMQAYINYIENKLGISHDEFDSIMILPTHEHADYRTDKLRPLLKKVKRLLK